MARKVAARSGTAENLFVLSTCDDVPYAAVRFVCGSSQENMRSKLTKINVC